MAGSDYDIGAATTIPQIEPKKFGYWRQDLGTCNKNQRCQGTFKVRRGN